ncbi:MAG: hypothetical protein HOF95_03900 [Rhodospirillales bacterium]|jgi:hypothetical protein|nr:hypothetical protein [Rhodospirillales bacterium]MBT4005948.1 hypothetical protein [Rhodospirillales bacterium]MBT5076142.1 hypothetical protein [Rhodospirillales bacterium]MBT5114183.1 hypothetical protein [Rhodospirillales bacterium]MBT5673228.1 hypothetical protein [Rhodospirillales bacterium]
MTHTMFVYIGAAMPRLRGVSHSGHGRALINQFGGLAFIYGGQGPCDKPKHLCRVIL